MDPDVERVAATGGFTAEGTIVAGIAFILWEARRFGGKAIEDRTIYPPPSISVPELPKLGLPGGLALIGLESMLAGSTGVKEAKSGNSRLFFFCRRERWTPGLSRSLFLSISRSLSLSRSLSFSPRSRSRARSRSLPNPPGLRGGRDPAALLNELDRLGEYWDFGGEWFRLGDRGGDCCDGDCDCVGAALVPYTARPLGLGEPKRLEDVAGGKELGIGEEDKCWFWP